MVTKKAQGLPLNLIVLAAIAALVLVLVISFTVGGSGAFFGKIYRGGQTAVGDELTLVKTTCTSACDQAKLTAADAAYKTSTYCTRTFNVDVNNDGKIVDVGVKGAQGFVQEIGLNCGNAPISTACDYLIGNVAAAC
ncbi:MAG: hypothetical protein AABX75_00190 [Nanoarchaeota archaeon]